MFFKISLRKKHEANVGKHLYNVGDWPIFIWVWNFCNKAYNTVFFYTELRNIAVTAKKNKSEKFFLRNMTNSFLAYFLKIMLCSNSVCSMFLKWLYTESQLVLWTFPFHNIHLFFLEHLENSGCVLTFASYVTLVKLLTLRNLSSLIWKMGIIYTI